MNSDNGFFTYDPVFGESYNPDSLYYGQFSHEMIVIDCTYENWSLSVGLMKQVLAIELDNIRYLPIDKVTKLEKIEIAYKSHNYFLDEIMDILLKSVICK